MSTKITGAGTGRRALPWAMSDDKAEWRAELPDGRTAVIRRILADDGTGSTMFRPTVHESRGDFVTGPACAGVLAAADWALAQAADGAAS